MNEPSAIRRSARFVHRRPRVGAAVVCLFVSAAAPSGCGDHRSPAPDQPVPTPNADAGDAGDAGLSPAGPAADPFGVREIYPTAPSGREWFLDMNAPTSDPDFVVSSATGIPIAKNPDGSWRCSVITNSSTEGVRMEVMTLAGQTPWKNVEISGYVRLVKGTGGDHFSWYARSGRHSQTDPCDGTAYHMQLSYVGATWYEKEVWHTGGYTGRRGQVDGVVATVLDTWVGFKAMIYNVDGDAHVKQEIWIDPLARNEWIKVNDTVDTGGWMGGQPGCNRPQDAILDAPRPIATFRADNAIFDFKWLAVREIVAP